MKWYYCTNVQNTAQTNYIKEEWQVVDLEVIEKQKTGDKKENHGDEEHHHHPTVQETHLCTWNL